MALYGSTTVSETLGDGTIYAVCVHDMIGELFTYLGD